MSKNDNSILSVRRAVKVQTSLRKYAQSRQKLYISYTSRGILRLKLRHLVRLDSGLGAKLIYMGYFASLLHPPGRKTWLLYSVRDMSWGL